MIGTLAVYAGGIVAACTIAVVAIFINGARDHSSGDECEPAGRSTALVKREHAPAQPVFTVDSENYWPLTCSRCRGESYSEAELSAHQCYAPRHAIPPQRGPVDLGMPQRRPDYRETAIREYAEFGIRACVTYVHAFDDPSNWGED